MPKTARRRASRASSPTRPSGAGSRRVEEVLRQTQKLQTVATIAGAVAHNFNNLLTIVLGNLDLAFAREVEYREAPPVPGLPGCQPAELDEKRKATVLGEVASRETEASVGASRVLPRIDQGRVLAR